MAVAGPWAGMILGSLGAEVIKIERPGGDLARNILPTQKGMSTTYLICNLNKHRVILDLKTEKGKNAFIKLASLSDVILENFSTGVMDRLGLNYETLRRVNPSIIYCTISGYGRNGPMANHGAVDPTVQAFSGWCSVTGQRRGRWEMNRYYALIDVNTGLYAVASVLQALRWRTKTGLGQRIEISMLEAAIAHQTTRLSEYLAGGTVPAPMGSGNTTCVPDQAFLCRDRQYLAVSVVDESQWERLCQALDLPELAHDPDFATNADRVGGRETLIPLLERAFKKRPLAWWTERLERFQVPHSPFFAHDALLAHGQTRQNRFLQHIQTPWGDLSAGGLPWHFSHVPSELRCLITKQQGGAPILRGLGL